MWDLLQNYDREPQNKPGLCRLHYKRSSVELGDLSLGFYILSHFLFLFLSPMPTIAQITYWDTDVNCHDILTEVKASQEALVP